MSKSRYITGLRAVEQLLATEGADIRRIFAEYQTANPRVEAIIKKARQDGIDIQAANRARLSQISGETRHQGVVAEVRRSTVLDEAGLRSLVEGRLEEGKPLLPDGATLGWLGDYGILRIGTSDKATSTLYEAEIGSSVALVMGREHTGLGKGISSRCDVLVSLPMRGAVSSLNVSVATGICLYEIVRRRAGAE